MRRMPPGQLRCWAVTLLSEGTRVILNSLVPMLFVQSVSRSIAFYAELGFNVGNSFTPADSEASWAWLQSGDANLMITRASHSVDGTQQAVIFAFIAKMFNRSGRRFNKWA